jgi:hypothetical protein
MHGKRTIDFDDEKPRDPYEILSQTLQRSLFQSLSARTAIIIEVCKRLSVDGVWGRFHVGCRIGAGDALIIKDAIARELGIPVLLLEWEGFDPRIYNEEQHRRRLELFKDVLNNSRQNKHRLDKTRQSVPLSELLTPDGQIHYRWMERACCSLRNLLSLNNKMIPY